MVEDQNKPCKCEGDEVQIEMAKSKAQVKKQGHHEPNHHVPYLMSLPLGWPVLGNYVM